ncbi:MAG TPA: tetratricopeptide repeat protein [Oculatellaceae cyanobacterium]
MSVDDSATSDQRKQAEGAESEVIINEQPGKNGERTTTTSVPPSHNEPVLQRDSHPGVMDADWRNPASGTAPKTQDELIEHLSSALEEMASSSAQPRQSSQNLPQQPLGPAQQIRSSLPPGTLPAKPQAKQDAPQHYFVLEGMAPPATPPQANPVQFEKTQSVPVEPKDGLQVRRMIATQQRMPAAESTETNSSGANPNASNPNIPNPNASNPNTSNPNPNIPNPNASNPNTPNPNPNIPNPNASNPNPNSPNPNAPNPNSPNPNTPNPNPSASNPNSPNPNAPNLSTPNPNSNIPNPNAPNPNIPSSSTADVAGQTTSSANHVQLPPMFASRQSSAARDASTNKDEDQQKARTGIQAIAKSTNDGQTNSGVNQTTEPTAAPPNTPPSNDSNEHKSSEPPSSQTRSHPVLTGHNFAPRQSDPRSTMSAMTALPPPSPQGQPAGPVSPLGAALASSLPSNPPTGHYIVPAALREDSSKPANDTQASGAPTAPPVTPSTSNHPNQNSNTPVGPATSRPIPKIDQSGAVQIQNVQKSDGGPYAKSAPTKEITGPLSTIDDADDDMPADATFLAQQSSFNASTALDPLSSPAMPFRPKSQQTEPQPPPEPPPQNNPPANFPLPHNFGKWPQNTESNTQAWGSTTANSQNNAQNRTESNPQAQKKPTTNSQGFNQPAPNTLPQGFKPPAQNASPQGFNPTAANAPPQGSNQPAQNASPQGFNPPAQNSPPQGFNPAAQNAPPQGSNPTVQNAPPQGFNPTAQNAPSQGFNPTAQSAPPQGFTPTAQNAPPQGTDPQAQNAQPPAVNPSAANQPLPPQPEAPAPKASQTNLPPGIKNSPNLPPFVQNQNARRTFTDLREETGLVLPHTAPAPDPNQVLHEEFGKSVPGVTPASKGFETRQAKEKREALEQEQEALNKIQLPARTESPQNDYEEREAVQEKPREKRREAPAKEAKPRRQADSNRSQRLSNLLNENSGNRSMRSSRGGGGSSGPIGFLQQNWRVAVIASLAVPLVASVSALVFMQGQSFLNVAMSPSQRAGEDAFKEGNYDRAISYFNEAIKADDKRAGLFRDRARAYMGLQEYGAAIADYTATLKLEPNFTSARLDRAASYFYLGDYPKAIADYDELIKANDRNVDAYFGRGLCHSRLHQYDQALADLNKVVELKPDHQAVFEDIANTYLAQGKLDEAIDAYSHSLKNNKRDANAYYMRANTYRRMGKTSQALADFSSAISIAPGRYEFYNDRGFALFEDHKYREAIADLSNALTLYPNYDIARRNLQMACNKLIASVGAAKTPEQFGELAYAYFNLENYSEAMSAANRALLQNAQYRPAMNIRAAIELKQKRFDYALTDSENILKIKADDKDALLTRARANLNLGRLDKAIKDYDTCIAENDNTSLFALRERALAHILANEGALAATDAQQFIDLNGWHNSLSGPTALLGWLAKRQLQDSDGASAILSQAETQMKSTQWPYPIFKFLKREITLSQLAAQARTDRQKTDVRTWSGFDHLLGGMREEAHNDFDWVKRSGFKDNDDILLSNEQLKAESDR